jgi:hypothetical protein
LPTNLYRSWFGGDVVGHLGLIAQGRSYQIRDDDTLDAVDGLDSTDTLTDAKRRTPEIFAQPE